MSDILANTAPQSTINIPTDSSASFSRLLNAGENIFTLVTGKTAQNSPQIIEALSHLADSSLPFIEQKTHFDLAKVLTGGADILTGITLVLTGLKTSHHIPQNSTMQTSPAEVTPYTKQTN